MEELRTSQPELAAAANNAARFAEVFAGMERQKREAEKAKAREIVCPTSSLCGGGMGRGLTVV